MKIADPRDIRIIKGLPPVAQKGDKISSVGIYAIYCMSTNKIYIGQSRMLGVRITKHKSALIHDRHVNKHLQSAWNLYGEHSFYFFILENCDADNLDIREMYYIHLYDSMNPDRGFNRDGGGNKNKKYSDESRYKMSVSHKGIPTGRKGCKLSPEHASKVRFARLGKKHSEETKRKMSLHNKGKGRKRGFTVSNDVREKIRQSRLGQKLSEETKRRLSESMKISIAKRKHNENSKS